MQGRCREGAGKFQGRFRRRALTAACKIERDTIGNVRERSSNGVMDKGSRKVQKASTHAVSSVRADVAVVEVDGAAADEDASSLRAER